MFPPRFMAILGCCLTLCATASAASLTDAVGRSVELPSSPQRIVSLAPGITEILFALGLADRIEGVTRFCDFPPEARNKPQVGGYSDPSLEAIAARHPDLVLISADAASPALLARIEALGTAAFVVYPRGLDGTVATIRLLGEATGARLQGQRIAEQLSREIARIRQSTGDRPRPRVLFCVMLHPLTVAGPGTLIGDLIDAAGGQNVVSPGPSRYPTWNIESLLAADPDLIVLSPHPDSGEDTGFFAAWPELSAVKNRRLRTVEADWVQRPGPRLALGLAALAEAFHGDGSAAPAEPSRP